MVVQLENSTRLTKLLAEAERGKIKYKKVEYAHITNVQSSVVVLLVYNRFQARYFDSLRAVTLSSQQLSL